MTKVYNVIGSNNFWYGMSNTKKEAEQLATKVLKHSKYGEDSDDGNGDFEDPETGHNPCTPEEVFIYESTEVDRLSNSDFFEDEE